MLFNFFSSSLSSHWTSLAALWGVLYAFDSLLTAVRRALGYAKDTDPNHKPGKFQGPPANILVNKPSHWRHHFDDANAYYCGVYSFIDKILGKALSLNGKTFAVTGASGMFGLALMLRLTQAGAKVVAVTRQPSIQIEELAVKTITWEIGQEKRLIEALESEGVTTLVINHGIDYLNQRTADDLETFYKVNTVSAQRLMELFQKGVRTNRDIALKEIWVNTSQVEVKLSPSPLYCLSKNALGTLVTLSRLNSPCVVRKLILGPFKSQLSPKGVMSADWVARQVISLAKRDVRNIVVGYNPWVWIALPIKEWFVSWYFKRHMS